MTFSDGVVWKAVGDEKEIEKKTKGPAWCFPSERKMLHLILGNDREEDDSDQEGPEQEIPE